MKTLLLLILAFAFLSCSNENPQTNIVNNEPLSYPYETIHYSFYYTSLDTLNIRSVGDTLEKHYTRIVHDLNSDTLPE